MVVAFHVLIRTGDSIDPRLTWSRYIAYLLSRYTRITSIVRRTRGILLGPSPSAFACVHRSLTLSRILYVASYLPPTTSLWEWLQRAHRTGLRAALGFPTARNEVTWNEAQDRPARLYAEHRALRHLHRFSRSTIAHRIFSPISKSA